MRAAGAAHLQRRAGGAHDGSCRPRRGAGRAWRPALARAASSKPAATTTSRKRLARASASAPSTRPRTATTPPKALTGSPARARSQAVSRSAASAAPQGLPCLTMTTAAAPQVARQGRRGGRIEQVVVRERLARQERGAGGEGPGRGVRAGQRVERRGLVGVLAVAQRAALRRSARSSRSGKRSSGAQRRDQRRRRWRRRRPPSAGRP